MTKKVFCYKNAVLLFLIICVFVSCQRNRYEIDVSRIDVDMTVNRMEMDMFGADPSGIDRNIPLWHNRYGTFLDLFGYVIDAGESASPYFSDVLLSFCTDRQNNEVYGRVMEVYPGFSDYEEQIEEAFRHYLYYFPDKMIPSVYTCITGFNNSLIVGDSVIGISLDRYLGRESDYYPRLGLYNYVIERMSPSYIVPDVMYGWGSTEWQFDLIGYGSENVLAEMIHEGKLRFFQKSMLPEAPDTLLFGFTGEQMKFCRNNESRMWTYLMENDLLFSTDQFTVRKLVGEAPFTSYFTNESPGRAATWIGFRIVESYMEKSGSSLEELMVGNDVQKILSGARYAPK